jgi:hypothetical protein
MIVSSCISDAHAELEYICKSIKWVLWEQPQRNIAGGQHSSLGLGPTYLCDKNLRFSCLADSNMFRLTAFVIENMSRGFCKNDAWFCKMENLITTWDVAPSNRMQSAYSLLHIGRRKAARRRRFPKHLSHRLQQCQPNDTF